MKKILLVVATHGNEKIGLEVIENLKKQNLEKYFETLIANPEALKQNKRFLEADLNRSYPGEKNSKIYEKRKAFENLQIAKKYQYIIDIHEADRGKDDFIILSRKEKGNFPLEFINLRRVLFWPEPKGPMGEILENSIELEFGARDKDRKKMVEKATKIVKQFINLVTTQSNKKLFNQKKYFYVYQELLKKDFQGKIDQLKDFEKFTNKDESFYPILARQYLDLGIACYKMEKVQHNKSTNF